MKLPLHSVSAFRTLTSYLHSETYGEKGKTCTEWKWLMGP